MRAPKIPRKVKKKLKRDYKDWLESPQGKAYKQMWVDHYEELCKAEPGDGNNNDHN